MSQFILKQRRKLFMLALFIAFGANGAGSVLPEYFAAQVVADSGKPGLAVFRLPNGFFESVTDHPVHKMNESSIKNAAEWFKKHRMNMVSIIISHDDGELNLVYSKTGPHYVANNKIGVPANTVFLKSIKEIKGKMDLLMLAYDKDKSASNYVVSGINKGLAPKEEGLLITVEKGKVKRLTLSHSRKKAYPKFEEAPMSLKGFVNLWEGPFKKDQPNGYLIIYHDGSYFNTPLIIKNAEEKENLLELTLDVKDMKNEKGEKLTRDEVIAKFKPEAGKHVMVFVDNRTGGGGSVGW